MAARSHRGSAAGAAQREFSASGRPNANANANATATATNSGVVRCAAGSDRRRTCNAGGPICFVTCGSRSRTVSGHASRSAGAFRSDESARARYRLRSTAFGDSRSAAGGSPAGSRVATAHCRRADCVDRPGAGRRASFNGVCCSAARGIAASEADRAGPAARASGRGASGVDDR